MPPRVVTLACRDPCVEGVSSGLWPSVLTAVEFALRDVSERALPVAVTLQLQQDAEDLVESEALTTDMPAATRG